MNIYTFDIFITHHLTVEELDGPGRTGLYTPLQYGPLNSPEPFHLAIVKEAVRNISYISLPSNWWKDFSLWQELQSRTELPLQLLEIDVNKKLERIQRGFCQIEHVCMDGSLSIELHERFPTLRKGYQITARRKQIVTLKEIAAYNVAKCITSNNDIQILNIPCSLYPLVSMFLDTYSGDYMRDEK